MNRILRHIKDGFFGVFRHFALAFSSISSVTITLVLMSIFMLLSQNINRVTVQIEQNVALFTQIKEGTSAERIKEMEDSIRKMNGVHEVTYSDKDKELEIFIEGSGEEGEELFGPFRGKENPFLDAFIINVKSGYDIKSVADEVRELDGIYSVNFGGQTTQQLLNGMEKVRNIGFIFVIVLGGIAIFLIANTIGATIHSRSKEISIMRSVGATNWYIRWPFIIEGMIIGMIGSIIPILVTVIGYTKFYESQSLNFNNLFSLVPVKPLVWDISLILLLIGMSVGAIGSLVTVSRRLRWTR